MIEFDDRLVQVGLRLQLASLGVGQVELPLQHEERRRRAGRKAALLGNEHACAATRAALPRLTGTAFREASGSRWPPRPAPAATAPILHRDLFRLLVRDRVVGLGGAVAERELQGERAMYSGNGNQGVLPACPSFPVWYGGSLPKFGTISGICSAGGTVACSRDQRVDRRDLGHHVARTACCELSARPQNRWR